MPCTLGLIHHPDNSDCFYSVSAALTSVCVHDCWGVCVLVTGIAASAHQPPLSSSPDTSERETDEMRLGICFAKKPSD